MIAFIDDHRPVYGVEPICRVLPIAPSTYREHAARRRNPARLPARARRDEVLRTEIRRPAAKLTCLAADYTVRDYCRAATCWRSRYIHARQSISGHR